MENREVAKMFNLLGRLKELHGENPFRTKAYSTAYITIRKLAVNVVDMSREELSGVKGLGKTIINKIEELSNQGTISDLQAYIDKTPPGLVELLQLKGFGPKKVRTVWKEMGIESPGELLYACMENRLIELKGFGSKTQEDVRKQIVYFLDSRGKYLFGHIVDIGRDLMRKAKLGFPDSIIEYTGEFRRKMPVVNGIEFISTISQSDLERWFSQEGGIKVNGNWYYDNIQVVFHSVDSSEFFERQFEASSSPEFYARCQKEFGPIAGRDEESWFQANNLSFIPAECRESVDILEKAVGFGSLEIVEDSDIKGVVHTHTTYSDGSNTLVEMVDASIQAGYDYLVVSDHSKAAFYANGLTEDRVLEQMEEIDRLNDRLDGFVIFKSIECDILNDGSLDYGDDFLGHFDLVIASVHSNLKMNAQKANDRLAAAIANPHTRILGHPTGRLLLSREGYPVDHQRMIDLCAEHNVVIEINASPYRLDLDWAWIPYAQERGVMLSINPDAHSIKGIGDIQYGVAAARKGGLLKSACLNAKNVEDFTLWVGNL